MQVLIEHGHSKTELMNYNKDELALFYEYCIKQDMRRNADVVEFTAMAIGTAFGGNKKVIKLLDEMRK